MAAASPEFLFGVIGRNLGASLSPLLHACDALYTSCNVVAPEYQRIELTSKHDLGAFLVRSEKNPCAVGFNVTTPWKRAVAEWLGIHATVSAVNTVFRAASGEWMGCNTDGVGFEAAVRQLGVPREEITRVIFLGLGGAVDAVLDHCFQHRLFPRLKRIVFFRRQAQRDAATVARDRAVVCEFEAFHSRDLARRLLSTEPTLIVQATPRPHLGDAMTAWADALASPELWVLDLCYNPASALVARAGTRGIDGTRMLIAQAQASQQIWFQTQLPDAVMDRQLRQNARGLQ